MWKIKLTKNDENSPILLKTDILTNLVSNVHDNAENWIEELKMLIYKVLTDILNKWYNFGTFN